MAGKNWVLSTTMGHQTPPNPPQSSALSPEWTECNAQRKPRSVDDIDWQRYCHSGFPLNLFHAAGYPRGVSEKSNELTLLADADELFLF